jgi:hypothetical protein
LFNDPIAISIVFRYTDTADPCGTPPPGFLGRSCTALYFEPWNAYINALLADARTCNDMTANASLPGSALTNNMVVSSANGRSVGLNTPGNLPYNGGMYDATVTLNPTRRFNSPAHRALVVTTRSVPRSTRSTR